MNSSLILVDTSPHKETRIGHWNLAYSNLFSKLWENIPTEKAPQCHIGRRGTLLFCTRAAISCSALLLCSVFLEHGAKSAMSREKAPCLLAPVRILSAVSRVAANLWRKGHFHKKLHKPQQTNEEEISEMNNSYALRGPKS